MGIIIQFRDFQGKSPKPNGCRLTYKARSGGNQGSYSCGYNTTLSCSECKYGQGRKDPEAKCNEDK